MHGGEHDIQPIQRQHPDPGPRSKSLCPLLLHVVRGRLSCFVEAIGTLGCVADPTRAIAPRRAPSSGWADFGGDDVGYLRIPGPKRTPHAPDSEGWRQREDDRDTEHRQPTGDSASCYQMGHHGQTEGDPGNGKSGKDRAVRPAQNGADHSERGHLSRRGRLFGQSLRNEFRQRVGHRRDYKSRTLEMK